MNPFLNFFRQMQWGDLSAFLSQLVAVFLCLTVHEVSHGLAAYALGDPTAKERNRLSLNPLRHLDPFGTLAMLVFGFGWAKPVPVDMRYFKNPKTGMAITALAGPVSNFLLSYVALVVANLLLPIGPGWGVEFCVKLCLISLGLGIFNLIPFPPLDGSKVLGALLPDKLAYTILRYERYGMLILMLILSLGWLDAPLAAARTAAFYFLQNGAAWAASLGAMLT